MGSLTLCSWKWFSSRDLKTAELLNIQDWPRQYFAFFLAIYLLKQESPVYQPPKTQQLTTSALDLYITLSSIGVHPNPPEIWRTLPWRIETRNRKTTMKNTLFFFSKLLFVPIANNFSFVFWYFTFRGKVLHFEALPECLVCHNAVSVLVANDGRHTWWPSGPTAGQLDHNKLGEAATYPRAIFQLVKYSRASGRGEEGRYGGGLCSSIRGSMLTPRLPLLL